MDARGGRASPPVWPSSYRSTRTATPPHRPRDRGPTLRRWRDQEWQRRAGQRRRRGLAATRAARGPSYRPRPELSGDLARFKTLARLVARRAGREGGLAAAKGHHPVVEDYDPDLRRREAAPFPRRPGPLHHRGRQGYAGGGAGRSQASGPGHHGTLYTTGIA